MRNKIIFLAVVVLVVAAFAFDIIPAGPAMGWIRHVFYRATGSVSNIKNAPPAGNPEHGRICRENLHRLQAAKRKAAFDRGQHIGPITWEETLRAMPDVPKTRLSAFEMNKFIPKCPSGGNYTLGTMEEVPRCTVGGGDTLKLDDDHVIRD